MPQNEHIVDILEEYNLVVTYCGGNEMCSFEHDPECHSRIQVHL